MDAVIFALTYAAIAGLLFVGLSFLDRRVTVAGALLCAAYLGLDDLVTGLPSASAAFSIFGGQWNWSGKIYSLLLSGTVLFALGIRPEAAGLTLSQRHLRSSLVALLFFGLWGFSLGAVFEPESPTSETLLFQATMPGLSEELAYRGIAPALLLGLIRGQGPVGGIPWGVVVATAIMFGAWHGLGYGGDGYSFDAMSALLTFIGSLGAGWLRFHSGSLLFPVLAHGIGNLAFYLPSI